MQVRDIALTLLDTNETRQLREAIEMMIEFDVRLMPSADDFEPEVPHYEPDIISLTAMGGVKKHMTTKT
jgi:hypothetical protein